MEALAPAVSDGVGEALTVEFASLVEGVVGGVLPVQQVQKTARRGQKTARASALAATRCEDRARSVYAFMSAS